MSEEELQVAAAHYTQALEQLGYEVAQPMPMPDVIHVSGYGLASYYRLEDTQILDGLVEGLREDREREAEAIAQGGEE